LASTDTPSSFGLRFPIFPRQLLVCVILFTTHCFAADDAPFPDPGSKKGLQVEKTEDALALGIRHAAINCSLSA
jgi:hypothetical protein